MREPKNDIRREIDYLISFTDKIRRFDTTKEKLNFVKAEYRGANKKTLKPFLFHLFSPFVKFRIDTGHCPDVMDKRKHPTFASFRRMCELLNNKPPEEIDAGVFRTFALSLTDEQREFMDQFFAKSLNMTVTMTQVNGVCRDLITRFSVQKTVNMNKKPLCSDAHFFVLKKYDGIRAVYYDGELLDRSGVLFEDMEHIKSVLSVIPKTVVLDGELVYCYGGSPVKLSQLDMTLDAAYGPDIHKRKSLCFMVYDVIRRSDFESGYSPMRYSDRRRLVDIISQNMPKHSDRAVQFPAVLYSGDDQDKIRELIAQKQDNELGVIVYPDEAYRAGGCGVARIVDEYHTMTLPVVRAIEGKGRNIGMLGSLDLDDHGSEVHVYLGFTDKERQRLWKNEKR